MITCVTVGHPHDKKAKPEVITGPDVAADEHIKKFKALCASRSHEKYELVQVISSSSGNIRSSKFLTPKDAAAREKARAAKSELVANQGKPTEDEAKPKKPAEASKKS